MDIYDLKYNMELIRNQVKLERELKLVEQEIKNNQKTCEHIGILVGIGNEKEKFRKCLLCSSNIYSKEVVHTIDASAYKKSLYNFGSKGIEREERILDIQKNALRFIQENPYITREELIEKMEALVKTDSLKTNAIEKNLKIRYGSK